MNNEYVDLTEKEYYTWLKDPDIKLIKPEYCEFSSAGSGPHTFAMVVEKNGIQYELSWGWGWNFNDSYELNYGVKPLFKSGGQDGDGI